MRAKLLDLCDIRIGRTPPRKQPQWFSRHYGNKWVSIKDMGLLNKYLFNTAECLTNDAVEKFNVPKIERGTIILSFKLTVGRTAIVSEDMYSNEAIAQLPIRRSAARFVDRDYLYYKLKYYDFSRLGSTSSIATAINSKMLADMEIDLPDLATQKKIAGTLSAFDDKIELNRQMNKTLEEMGRTLFKYYFIENPEAKNWPMVKVGDVLQSIESGSRPRGGATKSGIPSVGAENVIGLGKYDYSKEKYISVDYFKKLKHGIIQSGDVLLYKDGAYVGKKTMFMDGFPHGRAAVNEHVFILRTNNRLISQSYLYYWLDQNWITQMIINAGIAKSAQPGINQRDVECLPILLPPVNETNKFNNCCKLLLSKIFANALESRALAKARDVLSLKLIN